MSTASFIVQCVFAAAFYPLFLLLVDAVCAFFAYSEQRAKKVVALLLLVLSAVFAYASSVYMENIGARIAIHLIASCFLFILAGQYATRIFNIAPSDRKAFVFSIVLVLQPVVLYVLLLSAGLAHYGKMGLGNLLLIELARWILTLPLSVYHIHKSKVFRYYGLIALGLISFIAILLDTIPKAAPL